MGRFLNEIKYQITIGKIIGFVFFKFHSKSSRRNRYQYFLVYIAFYAIIICHNYVTVIPNLSNYPFWITFTEQSFLAVLEIGQILLPIYYLLHRRDFKKLLITIDKYAYGLNKKDVGYSIWVLKKPGIFFYLPIYGGVLMLNIYRNRMYFLLYAMPLHFLFFQQYFIYKIVYELSLQYQSLVMYLSNAGNVKEISYEKLTQIHCQSFRSLQIIKEVNQLFGLPILINIFSSFVILISCINYWQYSPLYLEKTYMDLTENFIWILWILCKLFYTIDCWMVFNMQVCTGYYYLMCLLKFLVLFLPKTLCFLF